ncbi:ATPase [Streptomyces spiroverticillatus]|uniref:histidine kinase n=1 Tax=Streptomyces finlayi TaxID=67296 RepID=A0A918WWH1_9ACTN|nr:histidine kinase [Streptomyces finlayi]GHA06766.1 ATPase [Streptomyces spiroverticillatus]GHC90239.1 ATPase [Streptomyces finlayi]
MQSSGTGQQGAATGEFTATPWPRRALGTLAGCGTALLHAGYFLLAGTPLAPFLLWPRTRTTALGVLLGGARRLTGLERGRRSSFFGDRFPAPAGPPGPEALRYLAVRTGTGLLLTLVLALLLFGVVLAGILALRAVQLSLGVGQLVSQAALGGVLLFLDVQGLYALAALDTRTAHAFFGPSERELLQRRIDELATSRAAVVAAVDTERRRIERDLHDGIQQRLVALSMLLGRARRGRARDPERADALLTQAHQETQDVLAELREVTWRVYPSALDTLGLQEALGGVSERCALPVRTEYDVDRPLPQPVRTAAYFVISEAVTNAAKHAQASKIGVRVQLLSYTLHLTITDDGRGGADPAGGGLTGLRSRVAACNGVLRIDSPAGGPTTIAAELPCT